MNVCYNHVPTGNDSIEIDIHPLSLHKQLYRLAILILLADVKTQEHIGYR